MEIDDFFTQYQEAVWRKDAAALIDLYDPAAVHFDMWDTGFFKGSAEWKKGIEDWLGSLGEERVKIQFEMVEMHRNENVAFGSALIQFEAHSPEGQILRAMKNRITLGFIRKGAGWKVVHQHISAPVSSENLTAILEL